MKRIGAILGILAVLLLGSGYAEAAALPGEQVLVVEVDVPDLAAVQALADAGYTISNRQNLTLEIYATAPELAALQQAGYEYRVTGQQVVGGP